MCFFKSSLFYSDSPHVKGYDLKVGFPKVKEGLQCFLFHLERKPIKSISSLWHQCATSEINLGTRIDFTIPKSMVQGEVPDSYVGLVTKTDLIANEIVLDSATM